MLRFGPQINNSTVTVSGLLFFLTNWKIGILAHTEKINSGLLTALILVGFILILLSYLFKLKNKQNQILQQKNTQIQILHTELNHRVKNNLAYISSLMRLQGRRLHIPEAKIAIKEAANRIQAMAMIHRRLFDQGQQATIEMSEYLEELIDFLRKSLHQPGALPFIDCDLDEVHLEADPAIWIGLIINELVTNAFKYAFVYPTNPQIKISLKKIGTDRLLLIVSDNGLGLPKNFEWKKSKSMGLSLVYTLVQQLGGVMELDNRLGTFFHIQIPLSGKKIN